MYENRKEIACSPVEMPRESLTERLNMERERLQQRVDEIDTVLKALNDNPQIQGVLDVLQKCRAW